MIRGAAAVLIVTIGAVIAMQGWRARWPNGDVIRYVDAAEAFVKHGTIPDRGTPTSYQSYAPPGDAWLMLPGVVLLSDLRLFELPASFGLYLGTMAGIALLARACFRPNAAWVAVLLFAWSSSALFLAGSLWPRGHPFFYVWMAYFTHRWAIGKRERDAAFVVALWAAGMYVHMELAPAILMLPAAWYAYRPATHWRAIGLAAAASALLWMPYLRFEMARDFIDVRSQVTRTPLVVEEKYGWCDPSLEVSVWPVPQPPPSPGRWAVNMAEGIAENLTANFQGLVPGSGVLLLGCVAGGWLWLAAGVLLPSGASADRKTRTMPPAVWATTAGGLVMSAVILNEVLVARYVSTDGVLSPATRWTIRIGEASLILGAIMVSNRVRIRRAIAKAGLTMVRPDGRCGPLLLSLGVPWLTMLVAAEPGTEHRFVGLWPLQVIVAAGAYASIAAVSTRALWYRRAIGLGLVALVVVNPVVGEHLASWRQSGWAGTEAPAVRAADYLAGILHAEGRASAAIGYRFFDSALPDVPYPGADARGKIGGVFDAVLAYRHHITNDTTCAEGFSSADRFRVVQQAPPSSTEVVYVAFPPGKPFVTLWQAGDLAVQRVAEP